jgi:hypothetical protein
MAWFLDRILILESTATIPWLALYIMYYSIQGKRICDWSRIISIEISSQLSNFKNMGNSTCLDIWSLQLLIFMNFKGFIY